MQATLSAIVSSAIALAGCTRSSPGDAARPADPPAPPIATATLAPTAQSRVTGTIAFKEVEGGVEVTANTENLEPGDHAYHVHEKADDFTTQPTGNAGGRVACGVIRRTP